jgi:acyl carrier protein
MLDEEKLKKIMSSVLQIPAENIDSDTSMDTIEKWDSLQHMNLILALEDAFDIFIPDDEAANITSYPLIKLVVNEQLQDAR